MPPRALCRSVVVALGLLSLPVCYSAALAPWLFVTAIYRSWNPG